jgi:hypothetical protein
MTYKRSAKLGWLVLLFAVAYVAIMVYGAIPADIRPIAPGGKAIRIQHVSWVRLAAAAVGLGVVALGATMIIKRARRPIVVEPDGITDTAAFADRVPWRAVKDVTLDGSEQAGYRLILALVGPTAAVPMTIELEGVDVSPSVVYRDVFDTWRGATGRAKR